ncbi:MAG: dTDP-4-amino-4,6-dideoxygalactose transaminase [Bdellovibrionaceae bacterium]|nr:dTDP-4-amino-4,6-dideoxygalactose transaminase [Pseudobdellovibrionaceae bacterium]
MQLSFNWPHMTGKELEYIAKCHANGKLAGDGPFTKSCHRWLTEKTGASSALLTHSCTAALEMSALLLELQPGDEVIMPSYTFVSTANAFVLRGAVPRFIDIREDTLNIDERLIESAISEKTRAIVPVHYAGVACEMDEIINLARTYKIPVVEDAAQGVMSTYKGRALGAIGDFGAYSFHETKNVISGEGGAILVNNREYIQTAEIIREKGTDRSRFFRGEVDKYTWQTVGSSFLPGELIAAFLWAQLEDAEKITELRMQVWEEYHKCLEALESAEYLRRPTIPRHCGHNAHMYYVILDRGIDRQRILAKLKESGVSAVFHYVPLHSSPGGKKYGKTGGSLNITDDLSERILRLPLWVGMSITDVARVVEVLNQALKETR